MKDTIETNDSSSYDARFAASLGGSEYDDLLLVLDFYAEFQAETGKAIQEYIAEHCQGLETIKVLEAGTGTGITTLELLKADPRVQVISVDNEPKMLDAVKEKFAANDVLKDRVNFILSDILKYLESCEDESIDAFASVYTIHNFTTEFRKNVIALVAKKLKKGGIFINGDKYAREEEMHQKDLLAEVTRFDRFLLVAAQEENNGNAVRASHLRQVREDWVKHYAEDDENKITVEEQNSIFKELGFVDVRWEKRFDLQVTVKAIKE